MSVPGPGQTAHLLNWRDKMQVRHDIEGRNGRELKLYTTDDLRRLYQSSGDELIRLRDGIVSRTEIVAEIDCRVFWARIGNVALFVITVIGAVAAVIAAVEGWK
jgi:hypothetical protein